MRTSLGNFVGFGVDFAWVVTKLLRVRPIWSKIASEFSFSLHKCLTSGRVIDFQKIVSKTFVVQMKNCCLSYYMPYYLNHLGCYTHKSLAVEQWININNRPNIIVSY